MEKAQKIARLSPMSYGEGAHESGANPDFQVTSASRAAREMDRLLQTLSARSDSLDRKMKALQAADDLRQRAAAVIAQPDPVLIEPVDPVRVDPPAPAQALAVAAKKGVSE